MKLMKLSLVIMAAALLTIGFGGMAYAFHSGGVAECGGCHSMHSPNAGGSFLLVSVDQSSTCLTCHEAANQTGPTSYHVSTPSNEMPTGTPPKQRSPGGDFGWLKKTYTFTVRGTATTEDGQTHGHNIVAGAYNYIADTDNTTAPGGTFQASQLGCQSCHDPHGQGRRLSDGTYATTGAPIIGSGSYNTSLIPAAGQAVGLYRLLASPKYSQAGTGATFTSYPIAVAPSTYNRKEDVQQTRVAYGHTGTDTWGNWCATCHSAMHSNGNYVHPVDETLGSTVALNYTNYVKSGDLSGVFATGAGPYSSLVPFAENTGDFTTLASHAKIDGTALGGPQSSDRVMCLSCHRAHASGWEFGLRWNMEGEFMTYNGFYPGTDTTSTVPQFARGRLSTETAAAYYERPISWFATYQRVLCNKCHAKD